MSPSVLSEFDEIVFYPYLYGKTFWLVSFFLYYPNNKFFSIYNYLFRFFLYSVFNEHLCRLRLLVEMMGFEPMTPCLQGRCSPNWATPPCGSEEWIVNSEKWRISVEKLRFSSLFIPFEFPFRVTQNWTTTDPYEPASSSRASKSFLFVFVSLLTIQHPASFARCYFLHRKEVIQPHLPIRLPCYDLTPIIRPTFDCCPLAVSSQASGVPNFHGLTGGVYKARERIHRGMLIRDY